MSFHLAWRNLVFEESHALTTGATIVTGDMASLRTPQLADRVTLQETGTDETVSIIITDDPAEPDEAGRSVQALALLDLEIVLDGTWTNLAVNWQIGTEPGTVSFPIPNFADGFPRNAYLVLPAQIDNVDITMVTISGQVVGAGTLTVSLGAIWQGPALELPVGPIRLRHLEQARSTSTPGAQRYGEDSVTVRELRFDCEGLSQALAIGTDSTTQDVQQAIQYAGETGAVLVIPFAADDHVRHRLGVYGVMTNTGELARRAAGVWQWSGAVVTEQR